MSAAVPAGPEPGREAVPTAGPAPVPEPTRRLAPAARWLWRTEAALTWGGILLVGNLVPLDGLAGTLASVLPVLGLLVAVAVVPELRWRRWRYEVRPEEIDIRRGAFEITRTLVPMLRVQHVDTSRGLLEQAYGLSTVVFHTAAGANRIPALRVADAAEVRDRIAELARQPDVV